ncbi:allantoin racemase [Cytobacillus horneckiae]|uniref:Hydrogenase expression protein HupH n=1 Tax=Cytobacillus horneckiae TaxID=549687 RepID=A0A2N0ZET8_9BACI|nr:aspartate/glutamate racemase family protein [Cytobacillus horneckiae]NRG45039.1 aspartate/glutamate racemase family protein [Bacillus sp. CRN 9]MBN6889443.1 aspartate/glutamate racemase family protein [Cytobacillus horneckiae]MCM3176871.1 aspartate/glutamate racemase family protein [Cytobacillus horneckiae]MEC1156715.1 aspartate/glutamate racemase family protein [Cytobacillus horneckiae]MED2939064.1 aspartate/glutamate racemase family protein [Cytobacillus horneckiae]
MKIKVIAPIISDIFNKEMLEEFSAYASSETKVAVANLSYGPASVESEYDEALCIPNFLEKAKEAEAEGYDGVISNCFGDPGVKPAREILDIPVIGPCEASLLITSSLAKSFSVVTVLPNVVTMIENISKTTGVSEKLASVRYVNIPVLEVHEKDRLKAALYEEMVKAIEQDHAHALVLGCTGFMGVAAELQAKLKDNGYDVPVIDPAFAATKMVETLVSMGVKQSRLTYMTPPSKQRVMN